MVPGSVEALEKPDKSSGLKRHEKSFESYDGLRRREAYVFSFFFLEKKGGKCYEEKMHKILQFWELCLPSHKNIKLKSNFIYFISLTLV